MRRTVATIALTIGLLAGATGTALADPITCPPGQTGTHNPADGGWVCVNAGGNTNQSEDPRNPNADKGDYQR